MNMMQRQFYNFIMDRTENEHQAVMEALLEEGFARHTAGTFDSEYTAEYMAKMLDWLMPECVEEVKKLAQQFGKHM